MGNETYIQTRKAICQACPAENQDGVTCFRCDRSLNEIIRDPDSSCPISRFKSVRLQIQEQISENVPFYEIERKLAICRQCPYSTTGTLEDCDVTSGNPVMASIVRKVGDWMVGKGLGDLRCKKCGCFCGAKARYGSLVQIVTGGMVDGQCPDIGEDGLNNWDRGYCV